MLAALIIVGPAITVLGAADDRSDAAGPARPVGRHRAADAARRPAWYDGLREKAPIPLPADPTATLVDAVKTVATFLAGRAGSILQNVASFVFQLFVMLFGLFYFLRDGDRIVEPHPATASLRTGAARPDDHADVRPRRGDRRLDLRRGHCPGGADGDSPSASSASSRRCSGA